MIPELVQQIEASLKEEISLYEEYYALLESEREHITQFSIEKVKEVSARREDVSFRLVKIQEARTQALVNANIDPKLKLTEIVKASCKPGEAKVLLALISKLKWLLSKVHKRAQEFSQIVDFSLNVINGSVQVMWTTAQGANRAYGANGVVKDTTTPRYSRNEGTLKQA